MRFEAFNWFMQRITGAILFLILTAHFWVLHYAIDGELTYEGIAVRLQSPAWKALDVLFLVLVVYHALYGLWAVLRDYNPKGRAAAGWLLLAVGVVAVAVGASTILSFRV